MLSNNIGVGDKDGSLKGKSHFSLRTVTDMASTSPATVNGPASRK